MIDRRKLLIGIGATTLFPKTVLAQAVPFQWLRPGYDPFDLDGTKTATALDLILTPDLVPPHIAVQLRQKVAAKDFRPERISDGQQSTRMLFGRSRPVMARNVVAVTTTQEWARVKSQNLAWMDVYKVTDPKTHITYSLGRPHPCGNWRIALFELFGACIEDKLLCSYDCRDLETLRKAQFMGS